MVSGGHALRVPRRQPPYRRQARAGLAAVGPGYRQRMAADDVRPEEQGEEPEARREPGAGGGAGRTGGGSKSRPAPEPGTAGVPGTEEAQPERVAPSVDALTSSQYGRPPEPGEVTGEDRLER